jgi:hypothetical protein
MEQAAKITGAIMIAIAVLLILENLGIPLRAWMGPIILIAFGVFALVFPHEFGEWRRQQDEHHQDKRDDRDE